MFQSFDQLNDAVKSFSDTTARFKVDQLTAQIDKLKSLANQIQVEYARAYSQVQWMKYDEDGNPTDVTPGPQTSVPKATIAKAKATLANVKSVLDALPTGQTSSKILNPLNGYFWWKDDANAYFDDSGNLVIGNAPSPSYLCKDAYLSAVASGNHTITWKQGSTTVNESIVSGHNFYLLTYNLLSGSVGRLVYEIYDRVSSEPLLTLSMTNMGVVSAIVYWNSETILQMNGTINITSVTGLTFLDKIRFILSRANWGAGNNVVFPDGDFFTVSADSVNVQIPASEVTLTYPSIDITTLVNNYNRLVSAINSLSN